MPDSMMDRTELAAALTALGETLAARGLVFEVVLIGGGNLLLRGLISRPTKDADLLGQVGPDGQVIRIDRLPDQLAVAVQDVADTYGLRQDWLNVGPGAILDQPLPEGFEARLERVDYGAGLVVWFAGLYDQVCFKLHAAADAYPLRDRHIEDLEHLAPSRTELLSAGCWTLTHDESPGYRRLLVETLRRLGVEDAGDALSR